VNRIGTALLLLFVGSIVSDLAAESLPTSNRPLPPPVPFARDSGNLPNPAAEPRLLHVEPLQLPGAAWLRVYFRGTRLGPGSYLRVTSELDGETQRLDAETLALWSETSAYFNGDSLTIELIGGPETQENHLIIDQIAFERLPAAPDTLCGPDDRVPSEVDFAGRILPNGCSAAVWNERSCLVSAGHCYDAASDAQVIEFRVPLNAANCAHQHPPVEDQFPILDRLWSASGVGNDWAVSTTGPNNLGQKPVDRYGEFRPIALSVPDVGEPITIWGYGSDSECLLDNVQQISEGEITSLGASYVSHNADTQGGNSGSGILHDGQIIAAHTHGGCPQNRGTRVDQPAFATARANLCIGERGTVSLDRSHYGCGATLTVIVEDSSLIGTVEQEVTLSSTSEPEGETLSLPTVYAGVFAATFPIDEVLPAAAGDGILSVREGDAITATYVDADDGSGNQMLRTATATVDCTGPAIAGVQFSSVGFFDAVVEWTTDEPASSGASAFGPGGGASATDAEPVLQHSLLLQDLEPCSDYSVLVRSADAVGNETVDDNGGSFYPLQTRCPEVPPVPDGSPGTDPVRVRRLDGDAIEVLWDNQCLASGTTKIIYGQMHRVSEYYVLGALCDIPADAESMIWERPFFGSFWFLVLKDSGLGVESSWGQSWEGERNGAVHSGRCGVTQKNTTTTCP
jgi:hypothetical protein